MSFLKQSDVVWLDGQFIPWQEANISVLTHTLHYGVGVFEGLRAYNTEQGPAIFRLQDHTDRLFRSAKIIKIPIPYDKEELNDVQQQIIAKNSLSAAYIRPMVFYGADSLGLNTAQLTSHVMVGAWEWGTYFGAEKMANGICICTSSYSRNHINSVFTKAKANGNYLNSILALQDAKMAGFDEALLLDNQGFVAEGSAENIFMVREGVLYTPELSCVLEGITRDTIFKLAADIGLKVIEKRITRDELYIADEVFFTGTAVEVTPIREIDGRTIGNGVCGNTTQQLQKMYFEVVAGKNKQYEKWITLV